MRNYVTIVAVAGMVWACASGVSAVDMALVSVGNPGNTGELSGAGAGGYGPDRVCGAVDYTYSIGKYEVTAGQYTEFLNAVAATDTYGLYNELMWSDLYGYGCKIERSGSSGNYTYSVASDWANRPVNYVNWGDAARFANWMHNGQPTGTQGLATTEDGSYFLNGAMAAAELILVTREPDATWLIPSEDEWYKAAYHKNDGATGNYFEYPTSNDSTPSHDLIDPDPGNNANVIAPEYAIGSPYYRTEVGEFENSVSPYGTFDQGGNVYEWTEAVLFDSKHLARGGSFNYDGCELEAPYRYHENVVYGYGSVGFRLAKLPSLAEKADFDGDGDVDGGDFMTFALCFNGSLRPPRPTCESFYTDFDGDSDVDGRDHMTFSTCFNGSLRPPKCN